MNSWSNYVGQVVAGRYQLENLLGVGSFGAVYAAFDQQTRQAIALRLLPPQIGGQSMFDTMSLTDFQHPNAVGVSDVGTFEETRYIVMPRISGSPIQVRDPWPVERVLEFVRQISAPLIAFQKQFDLQHLHLHLGNVFVQEVAGRSKFQLADLGLASQIGAGQLILDAIRERRTTPEFLSPEQLQGNVPSSQSDVYSFGAMLFQLLSGLPPFPYSDESLSSYALHVSKTPPPRFKNISDQLQIDEYLESIILRCLSKSSNGRPGSLQEFVDSYEMAYRDFQTRTLSGMTVSSLNSLLAGGSPSTEFLPVAEKPAEAKPRQDAERKSLATLPPGSSTGASNALPASDMLAQAPPQPDRNNEIPYRAYAHGADTNIAMSLGSISPSPMMEESQFLVQTLNPQLSPWLGMGGAPEPPAAQVTARPISSANVVDTNIETAQPQTRSPQQRSVEQDRRPPLETLPPRAVEPSVPDRQIPVPYTPPASSFNTSVPRPSDVTSNRAAAIGADQTLSPSSHPAPVAVPSPSGEVASSMTMQAQQDWLRAQSQPQSFAPSTPMLPRKRLKKSKTPAVVIILVAVFGLAGLCVLGYGKVIKERVHQQVAGFVKKDDYLKAKTALRDAHPLAGIWLHREEEIEQLLNDGLKEVERRRSEDKLAEAVLLTGQLDSAFADEKDLTQSGEARKLRQEIADGVKRKTLEYARDQRLKRALDEIDSDVTDTAAAFAKVSSQFPSQPAELNVRQIKRSIFEIGIELASERSSDQPKEMLEILDKWRRAFLTDDDITDEKKSELKLRHCQARVKMEVSKAKEEFRFGLSHFPAAIALLDQLYESLQDGGCSVHRPSVLLERSVIYRTWAMMKDGSETDSGKRFERSLSDLNAALTLLEPAASESPAASGSDTNGEVKKSTVLEARAETFVTRGQWYESQATAERSTSLLSKAIQDYKNGLKDLPTHEVARTRLREVREVAQSAAYEAFQSARSEPYGATADEHYCEASRQLTLVIDTNTGKDDDGISQFARLLRGLAQSSLRAPDYVSAISDLAKSTAQATSLRVTEIGQKLLPESSPQDRDFQLRYMFAIGRSRLAWLVSTCYLDDVRNELKGDVKAQEQSQLAVASLQEMIDLTDQNETLREELRRDACAAQKSLIVSLADSGQFAKAKVIALTLQGHLDPNAKGWESDERSSLENLLTNYIDKEIPFRVSAPQGVVRSCSDK